MISSASTRLFTLLEILCLLVICFSLAFSSEEDIRDLDIEIILSGIQYYDSLIQSGEGDVIYRHIQTASNTDAGHDMIHEYHLIFNQRKTRMDIPEHFISKLHFPKTTYINTGGEGEWSIQYDKSHIYYAYSTTRIGPYMDWDPRWITTIMWKEGSVYEHLKKNNFKIKQKENLGKIACYVLENTDGEKIWIVPEQGFRFLKYERKSALGIDLPHRGLKKGTPMVTRVWASYQKDGEVWFPKQSIVETALIDEKEQEYLKTQHETKNFRLNHHIPEKKFAIEIPDDAKIWVNDLRMHLSKKKFFNRYGLE